MGFIDTIKDRARANKKTIVLPETEDRRTLVAAEQILKEGIAVYPDTILCNPSEKSVSIHVFTGTWLDEKKAIARKINTFLKLRITSRKRAALFRKYIMRV